MAMPHMVFKQICEKELIGLSGEERAKKIDKLLGEMSGYKSGPYAEVRKWLYLQRSKAIVSKKILHFEPWEVKKQGDFTFALVGFPSVGKSSLIKALTGAQIQVAEYDFTTIKPFSAIMHFNEVHIQLIDLPGIIEGAASGRGFGRRVLTNALVADKVILVVDSTKPDQLESIVRELSLFGFVFNKENFCVVFTKSDLASAKTEKYPSISFSTEQKESIKVLKEFLFRETSLVRVFPFNSSKPLILKKGATVEDYCNWIHTDLKARFRFAFVLGKSAKFEKQKVGLSHKLEDLDVLELVLFR